MADKFEAMKERFVEMYNTGQRYSEITESLGISEQTLYTWRDKLDLPLRRENVQISWMDEKTLNGSSPRDLLEKIANHAGFFTSDIPQILIRYSKVPGLTRLTNQTKIEVLVATAYEFLRWEDSGRQPVSATQFARICRDARIHVDRSKLLTARSRLIEARLFPSVPLSPIKLLDKKWFVLGPELRLPDRVKDHTRSLMLNLELAGSAPESVVAGCIYLVAGTLGYPVVQTDLAALLGTTEVTIRNVVARVHASLVERGLCLTVDGVKEVPAQ